MRDTGVVVGRRSRRRNRSPYPAMTIAIALVGLAFIGWMLSWKTAPSGESAAAQSGAGSPAAEEPGRLPTPLFAEQGDTRLHLAVDPGQLTALAFHQAAGDNALSVSSLVPDADMTLAAELQAVPPIAPREGIDEGVWDGSGLRLWRSNRNGEPDTAMDMGGNPGATVWSPVTGVVMDVRQYLLYDKYEDYEVHIKPEGRDDIDVVLIHVTDVVVEPGDAVKGGVTPIAAVRKMSDKIDIQLGGYTTNGGDHVHMQLNRLDPGGQVPVPED